jgi:hypothetical protein
LGEERDDEEDIRASGISKLGDPEDAERKSPALFFGAMGIGEMRQRFTAAAMSDSALCVILLIGLD